jgi:hypothetical protein
MASSSKFIVAYGQGDIFEAVKNLLRQQVVMSWLMLEKRY